MVQSFGRRLGQDHDHSAPGQGSANIDPDTIGQDNPSTEYNLEDGGKIFFGADDDYSISWDESNSRFVITDESVPETQLSLNPGGGPISLGGSDLTLSEGQSITYPDDAGDETLANFVVTGTPAAGTEQSYSFAIDGTRITKIFAEADGAGGLQNVEVQALGNDITQVGGTTDASSGAIRLANNVDINARNAGNTADIQVIGTDGSDNLLLGANGNTALYDLSGSAADLRLATGQAIEDGGGTDRFRLLSGRTSVLDQTGNIRARYNNGTQIRMDIDSTTPFQIRDTTNALTTVDISTGNPGTLELTNANLDAQSNTLSEIGAIDNSSVRLPLTIIGNTSDSLTITEAGAASPMIRFDTNNALIELPNANLDIKDNNILLDDAGRLNFGSSNDIHMNYDGAKNLLEWAEPAVSVRMDLNRDTGDLRIEGTLTEGAAL